MVFTFSTGTTLVHRSLALGYLVTALSLSAKAATREEMRQLNMAYPAGSWVTCSMVIPGIPSSGQTEQRIRTRGRVITAGGERAVFDVTTTQTADEEKTPWLVYRYQLTSTLEATSALMTVDPASLGIVHTRYPQYAVLTQATLRKNANFRQYFSQWVITDFRSYRILPGRDGPDTGITECGPETKGVSE